uniref:Uncharacterized protein n=1 Tax=Rhizophora mucronata TaxID=61149 RepID=A0A2P2PEB8_RHIMU
MPKLINGNTKFEQTLQFFYMLKLLMSPTLLHLELFLSLFLFLFFFFFPFPSHFQDGFNIFVSSKPPPFIFTL